MEQQYHRPSDEDEDGESTRSSAGENISSQIERGAPLPSSSYSQQMHSKDSPALHPRSQENAASSQQGEASETQRIRYNGNAENAKFPKPLFTELTQHAMFQPSSPDLNSSTSPRFSNRSQALDKGHYSFIQPTDRSLPSTEVTDETLDDAYVQFILYCNPTVDLSVDSHELRRIFRAPPKSDGNSFSTFTLLELIRKLEAKEIKTWTQLAIKLGVEPPSTEKGQSTQKVQQYAVRLKVRDMSNRDAFWH
ncbi:MAG: hypothetical protein M1825_001882 [Sarcosagium campestre]|nr:MAG: hypothetical protein M1825_001882 [Sarcosagium campestre]